MKSEGKRRGAPNTANTEHKKQVNQFIVPTNRDSGKHLNVYTVTITVLKTVSWLVREGAVLSSFSRKYTSSDPRKDNGTLDAHALRGTLASEVCGSGRDKQRREG